MKIAVLSDIHANLNALAAVLEDAGEQGVGLESGAFWSLGDVAGYGPHPVEALNFLRDYVDPQAWVLGNHDAMLADLVLPEELETVKDRNRLIQVRLAKGQGDEITVRGNLLSYGEWFITTQSPVQAIRLNRAALAHQKKTDQFWRNNFTKDRLGPLELHREGVDYTLLHASRANPISRYLYSWHMDILLPKEFALLSEPNPERGFPRVQFFGHTHVPTFVRAHPAENGKGFKIYPEKLWPQETSVLGNALTLVNPGSVGQPRNLDRRACYAILDTTARTVTFRRVAYDWQETASDLQRGNYPSSLVNRLKTAPADKTTPNNWLDYYQKAALR